MIVEETSTRNPVSLDSGLLFNLLPSRIPGQVKRPFGDGRRGFVRVLIPAVYPDGQRIAEVYCKHLNGAPEGKRVLLEWEDAPDHEKVKRDQPHLIQASWALHATDDDINEAIRSYEELVGCEIRAQLQEAQDELRRDRARFEQLLDERVSDELQVRGAAVVAREKALSQLSDAMQKRSARLEDREAKLAEVIAEKVAEEVSAQRATLDQQSTALYKTEQALQERESQLDETVSALVEEVLAERRLELEQRQAKLDHREGQLSEREETLTQIKHQLQADRKIFAEAKARFESEGGQAYVEYLRRIEAEDTELGPENLEDTEDPFDPEHLAADLASRGYYIESSLLARAAVATVAAWSAGHFVILAGPTGVGKTQLVRQLAGVLGAGFGLVSVRPGWVDPTDLIGFFNPMNKLFEPAPALDHLLRANAYTKAGRLYALCLDEMNLSRVENYAADFLTSLESASVGEPGTLDLYSNEMAQRLRVEERWLFQEQEGLDPERLAHLQMLTRQLDRFPPVCQIPRGLVIFGTVNVDETTQMFSPKFLDRAYVLRFPPASLPEHLKKLPLQVAEGDALWPLPLARAQALVELDELPEECEGIWKIYTDWQAEYLVPLGLHFGHRFYDNFRRYISIGLNLGLNDWGCLAEGYFLAKIPPRIRFNPDERAIGQADLRKRDVLQNWIDRDDDLEAFDLLHKALTEMVVRSDARGMVEYWD